MTGGFVPENIWRMAASAASPQTGDTASWLPVLAIVVAAAALVALGVFKRRK